jgi:phage-related protein
LIAVIGVLSAAILVVNIAMTAWSSVTAAWTTITGIATAAQRLFNLTMLANPIGLIIIAIVALIAIIVLLVKNWDTVTEVVGKVWKAFKDFVSNAIEALGNLYQSVKNILQSIKDIFTNAFNEIFNKISSVIETIISAFSGLPGKLFDIGKSLATGLWNGLSSMTDWLRNQINAFFGKLVPSFAKKALGISSPSKVFAAFGEQIVEGLAQGISTAQSLARDATFNLGNTAINGFAPRLATATNRSPIYITINAGLGTDPYKLGREVNSAISKYGKVSSKVVRG